MNQGLTRDREPLPAQFRDRSYLGEVGRTWSGNLTLLLVPASGNASPVGKRRVAAFVYELAAEMERQSELLEGLWAITAEPKHARIRIELENADESVRAEALLASVMAQFNLA